MPAKRTDGYRQRMLKRAGEPILDIPDLALLAFREPESTLADFKQIWEVSPRAVVVPIISSDGVNFENPCNLPISRVCDPKSGVASTTVNFGDTINIFASLGCDVYLSIVPSVSFVTSNPLFLVDTVGETAHQTCITKDGMREVLSEVIAEGLMLSLKAIESLVGESASRIRGLVFDLVNIWPMGASGGRMELTCFCETCKGCLEEYMRLDYEQPELLEHFRNFPSPANLLLSDSGTGISYVESVTSTMGSRAVLGLCKMKGYDQLWKVRDDQELARSADYLMSYLRARHQLTVEAIQKILASTQQILSEEGMLDEIGSLQSVFLLEGDPYDWTSGLFLDLLDKSAAPGGGRPACDEIWMDPTSGAPSVQHMATRTYMWRRSRYMIDAFFDSIASVSSDTLRTLTSWSRYDDEDVIRMLDGRKRTMMGARMEGLPALQGLRTEEANRVGFVGAGLGDAALDPLIRSISVAKGRFELPRVKRGDQ